jgi:FkbM family methyltransferase
MRFPFLNRLAGVIRETNKLQGMKSKASAVWNFMLREAPQLPLPFRNKTTFLNVRSIVHPVAIRLGSTDYYVLKEIFWHGDYEATASWPTSTFSTVIDLGANVGFSILYWRTIASHAVIKGVEPDAENFALCRLNNQQDEKVCLFQAFVGEKDGRARIERTGGEWGFRKQTSEKGEINVLSISSLLNYSPVFSSVDLLKCDIEGGEEELFQNCEDWISKINYLVVETHPPYSDQRLLSDIERSGGVFHVDKIQKNGPNTVVFLRNANPSN